jgi:hypothetical protein
VVDETLAADSIEHRSSAGTLDPYVATTQLTCNTNYTVTLANAEPGTIKIVTLISVGEASVTISYVNGFGSPNTYNMAYEGELIIFYATSRGWHTRTFLD